MAVPTTPRWPKIVDKLTPAGKVDPAAGPSAGIGGFAAIALAKPCGQSSGGQSLRRSAWHLRVGCANGLRHNRAARPSSTSTSSAFDNSESICSTCLCSLAIRC